MNIFLLDYLNSALFTSHDDGGNGLDSHHTLTDFSPDAIEKATTDCTKFEADNAADLTDNNPKNSPGHDFWLTRNGHGAGFWDGDYLKGIGKRLTESAHSFGNSECYVGDDGMLYLT